MPKPYPVAKSDLYIHAKKMQGKQKRMAARWGAESRLKKRRVGHGGRAALGVTRTPEPTYRIVKLRSSRYHVDRDLASDCARNSQRKLLPMSSTNSEEQRIKLGLKE